MATILRIAPTVTRVLLGLVFVVFGLNGFLRFMPDPSVPDKAGAFLGALAATGYMFPLVKGVEVLGGTLLLANRFVPLALVLLAPNIVNIVLFHVMLAPGGLPLASLVLALELLTAWSYREAYGSMLHARTALRVSGNETLVAAHSAS
jgi:uncharacterized membrane protein YphA (DoxX/SURF4 family)